MTDPVKLLPILALACFSGDAGAAIYANFQVGSFNPSASPGYFAPYKSENVALGTLGNFQTTISTNGSWGTDPTPRPPTGVAIDPSWVDPAFPGDTTGLNALALLGGVGCTVSISMNFSTLSGGVLPAGSIIAYNDIDGLEQVSLLGTDGWYSLAPGNFYQAGVNVGSPWGSGQASPSPGDAPATSGSSGTRLILTGPEGNTDGVTNFIITQVDLTSLTITAHDTDNTQFAQALAIGIIPEPSSICWTGLAGVMAIVRRRRSH